MQSHSLSVSVSHSASHSAGLVSWTRMTGIETAILFNTTLVSTPILKRLITIECNQHVHIQGHSRTVNASSW